MRPARFDQIEDVTPDRRIDVERPALPRAASLSPVALVTAGRTSTAVRESPLTRRASSSERFGYPMLTRSKKRSLWLWGRR